VTMITIAGLRDIVKVTALQFGDIVTDFNGIELLLPVQNVSGLSLCGESSAYKLGRTHCADRERSPKCG